MNLRNLKIIITFIVTTFVISIVFSQTINDDNIEFLRVKNQKEQGNYRKALNILFNNISEQNKSNSIYLSYSAECYEKLGIYDSAVIYYYKLYSQNQSYDVMQKIAELKDKEEEAAQKKAEYIKKETTRKNCQKCNGTGTYTDSIFCKICSGTGGTPCAPCKASGNCAICKGTGVHCVGGYAYSTCNYCVDRIKLPKLDKFYSTMEKVENKGNGKCNHCSGTGLSRLWLCAICNGFGKNPTEKTCYH